MQQIKILGALDHPNICKYYEMFDSNSFFFFVTEYLTGGDLLDGLRDS